MSQAAGYLWTELSSCQCPSTEGHDSYRLSGGTLLGLYSLISNHLSSSSLALGLPLRCLPNTCWFPLKTLLSFFTGCRKARIQSALHHGESTVTHDSTSERKDVRQSKSSTTAAMELSLGPR